MKWFCHCLHHASLMKTLLQDMIENVLEIKDTYVREVMTPLVDVVAIDASSTLVDFHDLWVTHQYSRQVKTCLGYESRLCYILIAIFPELMVSRQGACL